MAFTVIIPARYDSTRLPGKPLREILGKPMVQWVAEAAQKSAALRVCVATDDTRIEQKMLEVGVECVMTSSQHTSGTDRLQEAAKLLGLADDEIVVNVQGDEPLMPPQCIDQVAESLLANPWAALATLCERIQSTDEYLNVNAVKVVFDKDHRALYFSRSPIPFLRDEELKAGEQMPDNLNAYRHIGLYAYRVAVLNSFVTWPQHDFEMSEKLEQLRAMANGAAIHVQEACQNIPAGVDTIEDFNAVVKALSAPE